MRSMAVDERLDEMRRQIEALEAKGRASTGEAKSRIQRQLGTLRQLEASARVAAQQADEFDEKFERFEARFRIAESAVAADLADTQTEFTEAVDDELQRWDSYVERLQAQTAVRTANARERAESTISDLRQHRNTIAERLAAARAESEDAWGEQKEEIGAARDELERKVDEFAARFK